MPSIAEDESLSLGVEQEQEIVDVLLLDDFEGELGFEEKGFEDVVKKDLEGPRNTGLSHDKSGRLVELTIKLEREVRTRLRMLREMIIAVADVIVQGPLKPVGDIGHDFGRRRKR